jgi:WD40 repeat protein
LATALLQAWFSSAIAAVSYLYYMKWIISVCLALVPAAASIAQKLETVLQQGHELAVLAVATHPDSNYVATASRDKSAKLWQLSTGREVRSFLGHQASVTCLDFSADGKTLITGSNDRSIKIWDVKTGKTLRTLSLDTESNYDSRYGAGQERISDVRFDPRGRFFIALGQMVHVWDAASGKKITSWMVAQGNQGANHLAMSADGQWLAEGTDATVNVYRVSDWQKVYTFGPQAFGFCGGCSVDFCFTPDSRFLIKATKNEVARYDLATGSIVTRYSKLIDDVSSTHVSPDGKNLAVSTEREVRLFDVATGDSLRSITAPEDVQINQVRFHRNNRDVLVAYDNNTVAVIEVKTGKRKQVLSGFLNQRDAGGVTYNPNSYWDSNIARYLRFKNTLLLARDGKTLLKGKFGTDVRRWEINSGKAVLDYKGHTKAVICYALSRDGKKLITGGADGKLILWNADTGDTLRVIHSYREPVFDVQFSPDETRVISASWDATAKVHDLSTGKQEVYFDFQNMSAYQVLVHPNDLYMFTARLDNSLQMWELDTKTAVRSFVGHTDVISSLRMHPDQKTILTASWDGTVRQWEIATGLMTTKWRGHAGAAHIAIYHPDGKSVFSAGADRTIRVWDMASGKVVRQFEGHRAEVTSLIISPDQKMLISHSLDGITKFWDLTTGQEFFEHIHLGTRDWMAKSPDGYFHGTDQARRYIHFVDGLKTYSVDQFFNDYYRPDLMPKIFQNRGGSGDPKGIQNKLKNSPPPGIKLAVLPTGNPAKADVHIKVTNTGADIVEIKLFHNGKRLPLTLGEQQLPAGGGQSITIHQTVTLVGGTNTFTASASNKDRVESDPETKEFFSEAVGKNSTCHVLAVGINQYKNPRLVLNYAKPDAQSFSEVVNEKGNSLFKSMELHTLYDEDATRANLLKKLDDLATKIQPEDVFIFYYAGHGSMVDNQFFLIPTETARLYDLPALKAEAVEASVLQERLKQIKALKQLIVMDACQSGASVELLATRGAAEEKAIAQLSRSAGIHVMASAGSEQFATEFAELGHGMFTYLLLKALGGEADGAPKDGKVTIYELKSYLDDQVPEMTRKMKGKPQYPYTFSRGHDFPVVVDE